MTGNDPETLGELGRLIRAQSARTEEQFKALNTRLDRMSSDFVPMTLYISERDNMRDDIRDKGSEIADLRAEVKAERIRNDALERDKKDNASRWRLAWITMIASPIIVLVLNAIGPVIWDRP